MCRRNIIWSVLGFILGAYFHMAAQERNAVKAVARPRPDSILLRWAPSNKETWKLGNQYGYKVERITVVENKVRLAKPKKELLTNVPLKPYPLSDWESAAKNNKYGAIAAQALFGEDFKSEAKNQNTVSGSQIYQKSIEEDMRFGFALFAADMDVATAKASGLRFVDRKVKKGDRYLYRVYIPLPNTTPVQRIHPDSTKGRATSREIGTGSPDEGNGVPPRNIVVDTALVYTGIDEYAPLPKPAEFSTVFLDSVAVLSWNSKVQDNVYVAYEVERSRDHGLSFQARTREPFVPILKNPKNPFAFYRDSTPANVELQYRIRGLNAFGEQGPFSVITKGKSQPALQQSPKELSYEVLEIRKVKLSWKYDAKPTSLIKGFKVYRSAQYEKGYKVVSGAMLIPKTQLGFVDPQPLGAAYYQVVAVDSQKHEHASFPLMVQFEDGEPPKAPIGLKGTIDKTGKVSITWTSNTEKDLLGYYIYASNSRKDEFSRLSPDPIAVPLFSHKISLQTLTDSIYYQVLALDKRYNESQRTLLALPRPDVVVPSHIALIDTRGTEQGIVVIWHNSTSKDAKQYLIYRHQTELGEEAKEAMEMDEVFKIISHKGDTTVFLDTSVVLGKVYQYGIVVEDRNGLRTPRKMYTTKEQRSKSFFKGKAIALAGNWDASHKKIVLNWKSTGSPVKHWIIYRSSQGERLAQYESAVGETFDDTEVEKTKTYQYFLRPVFPDRTLGNMSEPITVKFEEQ